MADTKLTDITAVTTPASTDEFYCTQSGNSRMQTRAQLHAGETGEQFLATVGTATAPGFAFVGQTGDGFYTTGGSSMRITLGGVARYTIDGTRIGGLATAAGSVLNETASNVNATVCPRREDLDSGMGSAGDDAPNIVAGAIEAQRWTEVSSHVLQAVQSNVGLTAADGGGQGDGIILSSFNEYTVVATTADAATLPAVFIVGTQVLVMNSGANSMDVHPANGDDAGAGADTAVAVAAGANALFFAVAASATWVTIFNA